jgi:hypothetical protein
VSGSFSCPGLKSGQEFSLDGRNGTKPVWAMLKCLPNPFSLTATIKFDSKSKNVADKVLGTRFPFSATLHDGEI